ncbi:MAG TPA: ATP-binding protein, partial [Myxococcaceae bacterium]|nr:ATP-binding protein [Myxococcaceae bacterium]
MATVLKLSQAVSGEIVLEKLIDTLLRTAIEHAGAERGLLVLVRGSELWIQAEANTGGDSVTVQPREAPVVGYEMPESVVRYTARTQESVLLDDAFAPGPFSDDAYIRERRVRSVLCLPLVKQGRCVALLYLENSLAPNVFTPSRTTVLKVLASQAAMGLESSHLYRDLQEREAKIRRLVDANIVGVVISHLDGQVLEANDAYLRIVGYTREDLVSGRLRWTDLTPPEWQAAGERAVAQLKESGTCEMFEKEYLRSDGTRVPALVAAVVIGGSPTQLVAFVLDLTERKRAEEERERLRQAHAELARISRVTTLGELTASLAHEIKQPIAAIVANAGACIRWLGREAPDLGEAREAVARISKDASRAAEIMNRVGALYRKGAARREPVDVNEVARETVALLRPEASRHIISIRAELAPELPEVTADRVQLQQVFMNLMLNGIEAMRDMTGELRIESRLADDGKVLISVSDEGVGLPPEADEIFQAFFTTKAEGTGMGLSISRSIVTAHGGRLWAS